jgi:hypothetical protein
MCREISAPIQRVMLNRRRFYSETNDVSISYSAFPFQRICPLTESSLPDDSQVLKLMLLVGVDILYFLCPHPRSQVTGHFKI